MTQNSKVLSMLGLAAKAGKVASGEFSTEKEVKSGNACLVIVAEDASDNTKKMFRNMCKYCLLYTSPSPRDAHESRMPSSA